jgi:hypothetical protein
MRFSQRSNLTGSTSMTSVEDESFSSYKSSSHSRKLLKRSKSPMTSGGERSRSQSRTRSMSREPSPGPHVDDGDESTLLQHGGYIDESEWDLAQRLELADQLARRNSKNQHGAGRSQQSSWDAPVEDIIYEGAWCRLRARQPCQTLYIVEVPPQQALRPASRASTIPHSQRSTTPQPQCPTTPSRPTTPSSERGFPIRTPSRNSERPRGPRSASPLPPSRGASPLPPLDNLEQAIDAEIERVQSPVHLDMPPTPPPPARRHPFEPAGNVAPPHTPARKGVARPTEPLSIKKKDSINDGQAPHRVYSKTSPLVKGRVVSPRRVSPLIRQAKTKLPALEADEEKLLANSSAARDGVRIISLRFVRRLDG